MDNLRWRLHVEVIKRLQDFRLYFPPLVISYSMWKVLRG